MSACTAIPAAQQTRGFEPVLVLCWASVADGGPEFGPALGQRYKASCWYYSQHEVGLLTIVEWILATTGDAVPIFNRHWVGVGLHCHTRSPANTRPLTSAGFMLGQRRRRWGQSRISIGSTSCVCWRC